VVRKIWRRRSRKSGGSPRYTIWGKKKKRKGWRSRQLSEIPAGRKKEEGKVHPREESGRASESFWGEGRGKGGQGKH